MRIHINATPAVTAAAIRTALLLAQDAGEIVPSARIDYAIPHGSRTHRSAVEVKLVSAAKISGEKRYRPMSGPRDSTGAEIWALTYDEWGWFLATLFEAHPSAKAGPYKGRDDFNRQTRNAFLPR